MAKFGFNKQQTTKMWLWMLFIIIIPPFLEGCATESSPPVESPPDDFTVTLEVEQDPEMKRLQNTARELIGNIKKEVEAYNKEATALEDYKELIKGKEEAFILSLNEEQLETYAAFKQVDPESDFAAWTLTTRRMYKVLDREKQDQLKVIVSGKKNIREREIEQKKREERIIKYQDNLETITDVPMHE